MAKQYTEEFKKDAVRYWKEKIWVLEKAPFPTGEKNMRKMKETSPPEAGETIKVIKPKKMPAFERNYVIPRRLWKY